VNITGIVESLPSARADFKYRMELTELGKSLSGLSSYEWYLIRNKCVQCADIPLEPEVESTIGLFTKYDDGWRLSKVIPRHTE
jgi:hypothetical protein